MRAADESEPEQPEHGFLVREERSIPDPALIGGAIAGAGAMLGPPLAVLTDHWLNSGSDEPGPPEIELPPGVNVDD